MGGLSNALRGAAAGSPQMQLTCAYAERARVPKWQEGGEVGATASRQSLTLVGVRVAPGGRTSSPQRLPSPVRNCRRAASGSPPGCGLPQALGRGWAAAARSLWL